MSLLSKYIRSLRTRRNFTELKLSQRAEIDLDLYVDIEKKPERAPLNVLNEVFRALKITEEEHMEFNYIAYRIIKRKKPPVAQVLIGPPADVLDFRDKCGLNGRRKDIKKLTHESDGE